MRKVFEEPEIVMKLFLVSLLVLRTKRTMSWMRRIAADSGIQ